MKETYNAAPSGDENGWIVTRSTVDPETGDTTETSATVFCPVGKSSKDAAITAFKEANAPPTQDQVEAALQQARTNSIKAECGAIITAAASANARENMGASFAAGFMSSEAESVYKAGLRWIHAMQAESRRAIADGDAPDWPELPDGVAELAAQF